MLTQAQAQRRLAEAETHDGFFAAVSASPINRSARRLCSYTAWNDQSLAATAAKFLHPEDHIDIVILDPSAEGGMPHTRPGLICLPAYYPISSLEETIRHEMIHIMQKRQPSLWETRAEMEGWTVQNGEDMPKQNPWINRCRLNPDTFGKVFAWQGHVPLPIYIRDDKPQLREIQVRWLDTKEGIVKMNPPTSFTQLFGKLGASEAEHPYELWAYRGH